MGKYLAEIKELGFLTKLDTNGTRPDVLIKLAQEGLVDYVALDVKIPPLNATEKRWGVENFDFAPPVQKKH